MRRQEEQEVAQAVREKLKVRGCKPAAAGCPPRALQSQGALQMQQRRGA